MNTTENRNRDLNEPILFDAGKTGRINVECFMADLIGDKNLWNTWTGKMPALA